jgi:hypothetical protein
MAEQAASLFHAVEWGELQLQNLRGWRINFGIRHEFHELARILFLFIRVNSCNSWQKRP